MAKETDEFDNGMIHGAAIIHRENTLLVGTGLSTKIDVGQKKVTRGYVAVEYGAIVNEGGMEFGIELSKLLKKPFRKIRVVFES